mgnify:CR=1 FL=1
MKRGLFRKSKQQRKEISPVVREYLKEVDTLARESKRSIEGIIKNILYLNSKRDVFHLACFNIV